MSERKKRGPGRPFVKGAPSPGRLFQKGKSGNPGGRPKAVQSVQDLARRYTTEAIEALHTMLSSNRDSVVVQAAVALLDRGWGRPAQALSDPDGNPLQLGIIVLPPEAK